MKILFKQSDQNGNALETIGIRQCYCKQIAVLADSHQTTRKAHHHTGFELHIVESGHQAYGVGDEVWDIRGGQLLVIPPNVRHIVLDNSPNAAKTSITFTAAPQSLFEAVSSCAICQVPTRVMDNLANIIIESNRRRSLSESLIGAWLLESIVLIFRALGIKENAAEDDTLDSRIFLATQYIQDNIEQAPTVSEVAAYCGVSERQLSRIFASEGQSPAEIIRAKRVKRIEELLADPSLSLKDIGERMSFSDEYYFNAFFKKYAGMTPGSYRKTMM